ncbi:hypothetical protein SteCoe_15352 [Stentor coeruleus]|uniref:Uncharacterized protein n=1 Tax=Stentor coeruleus TaxID=5963 RepID=A0A1R2C3X4_9CILI|nr:hypothetical protein SteCoe_15352 [Stentor coeruleus]
MFRSVTPLNISTHKQKNRLSLNIDNRRHTKEELCLLDLSWRENPPDYTQECMNCYIKGQPLPKIPQNHMKKSSSKNYFELNKTYISKISEEKSKKKPLNLNLNKIVIAIASSTKKNSKTSYNFKALSPTDITHYRLVKRQANNQLKVNQSCNFLITGSKF